MIKEVINNNNPFSKEAQYIDNNEMLGTINYSIIYERMEVDNIFVKEIWHKRGKFNFVSWVFDMKLSHT